LPKYLFFCSPGGTPEPGYIIPSDGDENQHVRNTLGGNRAWWAIVKDFLTETEAENYRRDILRTRFTTISETSPYGASWTGWFDRNRSTLNEGNGWGIPQEMVDYPWAGEYAPAIRYRNHAVLYTRDQPLLSNYALALRESIKYLVENNIQGQFPSPILFPTSFMPTPTIEITGEKPSYLTQKDLPWEEVGKCCSNCGLIGCKSNVCPRKGKAHLKVGIEVEGRWRNVESMKRKALTLTGGEGYLDGSLRACVLTGAQPWEFQTKPGNLREALEQLIQLYPDSVDERCGMHVHVSFNEADTGLLYSKEFFKLVTARMKEWGIANKLDPTSQFFSRLLGSNSFCRPNSSDKGVVIGTEKYSQINFSAWNKQKTVEYRSLPMFRKASLGVSAIKELLTTYEDFLGGEHGDIEKVVPKIVVSPSAKEIEEYTSKTPKKITGEIPWAPIKTAIVRDIEVNLPPPVREGTRRVAIPKGAVIAASAGRGYVLKQNGLGV
jgi:hypothetical protein